MTQGVRPVLLGYNTNGFAHHRLDQAIDILAEIGYQSVAITLDHYAIDPTARDAIDQARRAGKQLERRRLRSVVETGARFLLDPWNKHEPTMVSADPAARRRRIEFLCRAIDIAHELESDAVSFWSGVLRDEAGDDVAFDRLVRCLGEVVAHAERRHMVLAFEPEPGMFIDTMLRFDDLARRVDSPQLRLTIDVGHLHCLGETPVADYLRKYASRLANIHIEDMRRGVHEHLMFGDGEIDFGPVIAALAETRYVGALHVELSRHSHMAPAAARQAHAFLEPLVQAAKRGG